MMAAAERRRKREDGLWIQENVCNTNATKGT